MVTSVFPKGSDSFNIFIAGRDVVVSKEVMMFLCVTMCFSICMPFEVLCFSDTYVMASYHLYYGHEDYLILIQLVSAAKIFQSHLVSSLLSKFLMSHRTHFGTFSISIGSCTIVGLVSVGLEPSIGDQ